MSVESQVSLCALSLFVEGACCAEKNVCECECVCVYVGGGGRGGSGSVYFAELSLSRKTSI